MSDTTMSTEPDYYKQTARSHGHALTAISGKIHDLVWRCRLCGEVRTTTEAFDNVDCE